MDSSTELFEFEGDSVQPVSENLFLSTVGGASGSVFTQNILGKTGTVIRAVPAPAGTFTKESAIFAVVDRTVIVADPEGQNMIGLAVDSGAEQWRTKWQDAYWVRDGLTDGEYFVFGDYTGTHSIRARDGKIMWSRPLIEGADPRGVRVSPGGGYIMVSWQNQVVVWR